MENSNCENWQPRLTQKTHALISGTCGKNELGKCLGWLIMEGYDDIRFEYIKDGLNGRVLDTRILAVSANKKLSQRDVSIDETVEGGGHA